MKLEGWVLQGVTGLEGRKLGDLKVDCSEENA